MNERDFKRTTIEKLESRGLMGEYARDALISELFQSKLDLLRYKSIEGRREQIVQYVQLLSTVPQELGTYKREMNEAIEELHGSLFGDKP